MFGLTCSTKIIHLITKLPVAVVLRVVYYRYINTKEWTTPICVIALDMKEFQEFTSQYFIRIKIFLQ